MTKAIWGAAAAFMLCAVAASGVDAQQLKYQPIKPADSVVGSATFKAYCAQCHGVSAKGDGPAAKALKVAPADLTQLAKRNHGTFPLAHVKHTIAGDADYAAHGTREMPMWGPVFRSVENPSVTELRLVNLVKYLQQVQEK